MLKRSLDAQAGLSVCNISDSLEKFATCKCSDNGGPSSERSLL